MFRSNTHISEDNPRKKKAASEFRDFVFETAPNDELISDLANAYENQRARQVYEWEAIRQKSRQAVA